LAKIRIGLLVCAGLLSIHLRSPLIHALPFRRGKG
jgi:hypothetical protein